MESHPPHIPPSAAVADGEEEVSVPAPGPPQAGNSPTNDQGQLEETESSRDLTIMEVQAVSFDMMRQLSLRLTTIPGLQELILAQGLSLEASQLLKVALANAPSLAVLKIEHHTTTNHEQAEKSMRIMLGGIASCVQLEQLTLNDCAMAELETFTALVDAVSTSKVKHLCLSNMPNSILKESGTDLGRLIQPDFREHFPPVYHSVKRANNHCTNLDILQIHRCGIGLFGAGSLGLATFMNTKILTKLDLAGNPIGYGASNLLLGSRRIVHLGLSDCQVPDVFARRLLHIILKIKSHLRYLREIDLSGNETITVEGKKKLWRGAQRNYSLHCIVGMPDAHPNYLIGPPTLEEAIGSSLHINWIRHRWKYGPSAESREYRKTIENNAQNDSHKTSSLLPYYLAKVNPKFSVFYHAIKENKDLWLPHIIERYSKKTWPNT